MEPDAPDLRVTYRADQSPTEAFDVLVSELEDGLARSGITFDAKAGAAVSRGGSPVGVISHWEAGREVGVRWLAMPWGRSKDAAIRIRLEPDGTGCRVTWSLSGWAGLFDSDPSALPDWVAGNLLPELFRRLLPEPVGDWTTDRMARRPAGVRSREFYRDPTYHWPNFWLILDRLQLAASDRLLEVGCGGGAFLKQALESGCSATGIDHSPQMVALAGEVNRDHVRSGRLTLRLGDAAHLPVDSDAFSCCVSTGAIGFFPDPLAALQEMRRALAPGGRVLIFASTPVLKGTPAAAEPVASRVHFFEGPELADLAKRAGFTNVHVDEPALESYARKAGVPEEGMPLFRGTGASLLLTAEKPR